MDVDQILRTHLRERQILKVMSNHLANAYGTGDCRGQRSVLSRLAADCRVVFFQLYIRRGLFAQPNLYTTVNNLIPDTIKRKIPVATLLCLIFVNEHGSAS